MAFAVVLSITSTPFDTDVTSHPANHPATVNDGDLLKAVCGWNSAAGSVTTATPSGWTEVSDAANNNEVSEAVYVRRADGTEGGGSTDFVTSAAEKGAVQIYRIQAGTWFDNGTLADAVVAATAATGTSTTPDSPSLTPPWGVEENLYFAVEVNKNLEVVSAAPTNYTNLTTSGSTGGTAGSNAQLGTARREIAGSPENPPAFGAYGTSRAWITTTIAIRPAAAAVNLPARNRRMRARRSVTHSRAAYAA